ncbi:hypothetical protein ASF43_27870 [Pseudorhodoferax sp. Leaf267]|nr:hypothetical protein ASF43_27870 [Pseudorhodoferax sp. Leaf267]
MELTEINQTHTLQQFDASLGTLNSVTITLDGRVLSSASLLNEAAQTQIFGFVSTENFFLTGPGSIFQTFDAPLFNYGPSPIAGGQRVDLGAQDISNTLTFTAADLGSFIGGGTVDFLCTTAISNTQTGGGGNILIEQSTTAGCGLNVVYDYTADTPVEVPEPGSLALLGVAALGLVAVRRRRS